MVGSAAVRALSRAGQDVDLIIYEKTGEDDYGENYAKAADSPVTVSARVVVGGTSQNIRDAFGSDVDADAEVFIASSSSAADRIRGGGGDGATRVDVDQDGDPEFIVLFEDDQDNGLTRLLVTVVN